MYCTVYFTTKQDKAVTSVLSYVLLQSRVCARVYTVVQPNYLECKAGTTATQTTVFIYICTEIYMSLKKQMFWYRHGNDIARELTVKCKLSAVYAIKKNKMSKKKLQQCPSREGDEQLKKI